MPLRITITSFSYKKGMPADNSGNGGGFVFDCRAIQNPGREERYKQKTGQDTEVVVYLENQETFKKFFEQVKQLTALSVDNYLSRSFTNLSVSFGCTGGQHRSVYSAEQLSKWLKATYGDAVVVELIHRDMPSF